MEKFPVKLYVYDISRGLARQLSPLLLGKRIDGVWRTGLVCYDREFFCGGDGISSCSPGGTILGNPDKELDLGGTEVTQDVFMDILSGIEQQNFRFVTNYKIPGGYSGFYVTRMIEGFY